MEDIQKKKHSPRVVLLSWILLAVVLASTIVSLVAECISKWGVK
jgi:hypothetical protein